MRRFVIVAAAIVAVGGLILCGVILGGCAGVSSNVPVVGRSANDIYTKLQQAGLPVTDGRPSSNEFSRLVENNRCRSSRSFVRTGSDKGWAIICVGLDNATFRKLSSAFDRIPLLLGPLYADAQRGDVVVFGFGWPPNASKLVHDVIGAGAYLIGA